MKKLHTILMLLGAAPLAAAAAQFSEPKAYPISRYEAGWLKNPFTLKTAPVAVAKESFAKDLALAGWRQAGDDNIVILVNTKTREYSRLKNQEAGADGIKVAAAHLEDRRSDTYVELEKNGEKAVVRFDEGFQRQMAAQGAGPKAGANPQLALRQPNAPGQGSAAGMVPGPGGQPQRVTAPNINPNAAPGSGVVPTPVPIAAPGAAVRPSTGQLPGNIPTVQRRRVNTLPQPTQR
jgi:hypothetical protein